jgi:hypothetical protein
MHHRSHHHKLVMKSSVDSTSTVSNLFNKATAGIVLASSLLLSSVNVANANNNYYIDQEASKLFLQSEQALKETSNNYKIVDSQWQYVQQLLNNNYKIIMKSSDVINMITNDLMKIELSINKLIQSNKDNIMKLQEDVTNSDSLTSTLYQQAKKSSEKKDKPSG